MDALQFHQPVIVKVRALPDELYTTGLFLKRGDKVYNIGLFQAAIDPPVLRNNLIVLHSFYSCDTTSKFFAHPSYRVLTMSWAPPLQSSWTQPAVFKNSNLMHSEIHEAGSKLMAAKYKFDQDVSSEWLRLFKIKCNSKTSKRDYPLRQMLRISTAKEHSSQHRTCIASRRTPLQYGWRPEDGVL